MSADSSTLESSTARASTILIRLPTETAVHHVDGIMPYCGQQGRKPDRQALVNEELHADSRSGSSRSSTALAANLSAAKTASRVRVG